MKPGNVKVTNLGGASVDMSVGREAPIEREVGELAKCYKYSPLVLVIN